MEAAFAIIMLIIVLAQLVGTIYALIHLVKNNEADMKMLIWLLIILFAPFGWLIYLLLGR